MAIWVQKFGGTSLETPERIQHVARLIQSTVEQGVSLVVVVSAMGHTTDELLQLAHRVSERPQERELDMLLTAGERISMALMSMALADLGVRALSYTGSQVGLITENQHQGAKIKRILGDRVRESLLQGYVVIVAGFQGVSEKKEITTLGRGGSDTTAVALAAELKAARCEIYTDVEGVFSADPRIVPQARHFPEMDYDTTYEYAVAGAGVLHARCVAIAKRYQVPIRVVSSLDPAGRDTWVENRLKEKGKGTMEAQRVLGVSAVKDYGLLTLSLAELRSLPQMIQKAKTKQLRMHQPKFQGTGFQAFFELTQQGAWEELLAELKEEKLISDFGLNPQKIPVTLVGECFNQDGSILARTLDLLEENRVAVENGWTATQAVTVVVERSQAELAIQLLHREFLEREGQTG